MHTFYKVDKFIYFQYVIIRLEEMPRWILLVITYNYIFYSYNVICVQKLTLSFFFFYEHFYFIETMRILIVILFSKYEMPYQNLFIVIL